jgi:glucose-6-phosphate-specific signal transduction histidine kinase
MGNHSILWLQNKKARPFVVIFGFLLLFGLVFVPLHSAIKDGVYIISSAFPIAVGWILGLRLGLIFWLLYSAILMIFAKSVGSSLHELISSGIPSFAITMVLTSAAGKISDLNRRLKTELKERKQIELELNRYKDSLEDLVQERSKEPG